MAIETIEEIIRPTIFYSDPDFLSSQAVTYDFTSDIIDARKYDHGSIVFTWSSYDGTNGAINIQTSNINDQDDSNWSDWGGSQGALNNISDSSGTQQFRLNRISEPYLRLQFYIGNGTTVTIEGNYSLKYGK